MSVTAPVSLTPLTTSETYQNHSLTIEKTRTRLVHVTSSRFFGGPERQMLELANELSPDIESSFITFAEKGLCRDFLDKVQFAGFASLALAHDTPHLVAAASELRQELARLQAKVVCVHGYKAGLLGLYAARKLGIPVIAISRGWTAENWKVRIYERLDRMALRQMDRVICVSHGQAAKVLKAGVAEEKIAVIHNAIRAERFGDSLDATFRCRLEGMFSTPPLYIVGAAGRLSPEKGFDVLINACKLARNQTEVDFGIVLFGDGVLHDDLNKQIASAGLASRFVLAGFTADLDQYMPHFDLFVQSSHTEGLPNVLLEAMAAGVPVVATDVGGTREVIIDGQTGLLVPAADREAIASNIVELLTVKELRNEMKRNASEHVARHFTFAAQADSYRREITSVLSEEVTLA